MVRLPSDKADVVQLKPSDDELNDPSLAVQLDQLPVVESTWNCTLLIVPPVSVAVPERVGVVSVVGSGDRAVTEMLGAVVSTTAEPFDE